MKKYAVELIKNIQENKTLVMCISLKFDTLAFLIISKNMVTYPTIFFVIDLLAKKNKTFFSH